MKIYSAAEAAQRLPYRALVEALRQAFSQDIEVPARSMYSIDMASGSKATLGLMPAWQAGGAIAVKILTIFPDNASHGVPTIHAQILLLDGKNGCPVALIDGTEVTRRRTAATSALAASFLAHERAENLLIVGTGPQALHQGLAHASVRPIRRIEVWGRSRDKAQGVVEGLLRAAPTCSIGVVDDLQAATREADVISCVTSSPDPVVFGAWLKAGAFLDLVGNHMPDRRECDDEAARRSRIHVDALGGALAEAGELLIPLAKGTISQSDIVGDLHALCRGEVPGRRTPEEITLFKSVGYGLEDLAAAKLVAGMA
ncbi:MAG TPA: ornithine cyclodeaminase family protein [Xanthobacteraceae bacterium]|jgi:ornithine cyclodeaminase